MDLSRARLQRILSSASVSLTRGCRSRWFWWGFASWMCMILGLFTVICSRTIQRHHILQNAKKEAEVALKEHRLFLKQQELRRLLEIKDARNVAEYVKSLSPAIPLLQVERARLACLAQQLPDNARVNDRLQRLNMERNAIRFEPLGGGLYQIAHPVLMDRNDLRQFLRSLEGDPGHASSAWITWLNVTKNDDNLYSVQAQAMLYERGDETP